VNNDRIAELYFGEIGPADSQRRARTRIHWLCAQVEGRDVLDIGCSQGVASLLLAREGHVVTGVDIEDAALSHARTLLEREEPHVAERVTFAFAEAGDLPYDDASFDTVLLGEVLEHQVNPDPIVREARRVLREGGVLVITAPYGIFRYHDHKEPMYLRSVLRLMEEGYAVEQVEVVDKWLGVVARAVPPENAGMRPQAWALALEAAETRLEEIDAALEDRREALKSTQAKLDQARRERDALQSAVAEPGPAAAVRRRVRRLFGRSL